MVYHRRDSPTQTKEVAEQQRATEEIWGAEGWGGLEPKVKAYIGELPLGTNGIEFETDIPPDAGCPPGQAHWSGARDGVEVVGGYAKIRVRVTKSVYPCGWRHESPEATY